MTLNCIQLYRACEAKKRALQILLNCPETVYTIVTNGHLDRDLHTRKPQKMMGEAHERQFRGDETYSVGFVSNFIAYSISRSRAEIVLLVMNKCGRSIRFSAKKQPWAQQSCHSGDSNESLSQHKPERPLALPSVAIRCWVSFSDPIVPWGHT